MIPDHFPGEFQKEIVLSEHCVTHRKYSRRSIDIDLITQVDKELEVYDKISLIFLMYEGVEQALKMCKGVISAERSKPPRYFPVIVDQFVQYSKNSESNNEWKEKFIECLSILRIYNVLEEIGIQKQDAISMSLKCPTYVSRLRSKLYRFCESLQSKDCEKLIKNLTAQSNWPISNEALDYPEIFFLQLHERNILNINHDRVFTIINNAPEKRQIRSSNDVYSIKDPKNVGLCFILNIQSFLNKPEDDRKGSNLDCDNLRRTMTDLKFKVHQFIDWEYSQFLLLPKYIESCFSENHSMFFLVIMSHGANGCIFTTDNVEFKFEKLEELLLTCEVLLKIPKVVIIQACQGKNIVRHDFWASDKMSEENILSDYLLFMSTVKGFKSFRHENEGSIFIRVLCDELRNSKEEHIETIAKKVIRKIYNKPLDGRELGLPKGITMHPEIRNYRLTKDLFIRRNK